MKFDMIHTIQIIIKKPSFVPAYKVIILIKWVYGDCNVYVIK